MTGRCWVDTRAGSADLLAPLLATKVPVEPATLPAGDIELWGQGPGGRPLLVAVEYKKPADVLACVRDGRFAEQLRRMRQRAEVCWLLIEGEWRVADDGGLELRERGGWRTRGQHTHQELASWLLTMAQRGGVLLWRTQSQAETVAWLRALYWWWTSKDFEEHRAHLDWYTPPHLPDNPLDPAGPSKAVQVAAALLARGATVDVNSERAKAAAAHFGTVRAMVDADEKAWRAVEGIGPKLARQVVEAVG